MKGPPRWGEPDTDLANLVHAIMLGLRVAEASPERAAHAAATAAGYIMFDSGVPKISVRAVCETGPFVVTVTAVKAPPEGPSS
jgi:hypothetical protein